MQLTGPYVKALLTLLGPHGALWASLTTPLTFSPLHLGSDALFWVIEPLWYSASHNAGLLPALHLNSSLLQGLLPCTDTLDSSLKITHPVPALPHSHPSGPCPQPTQDTTTSLGSHPGVMFLYDVQALSCLCVEALHVQLMPWHRKPSYVLIHCVDTLSGLWHLSLDHCSSPFPNVLIYLFYVTPSNAFGLDWREEKERERKRRENKGLSTSTLCCILFKSVRNILFLVFWHIFYFSSIFSNCRSR